jgi:hypothetical protein
LRPCIISCPNNRVKIIGRKSTDRRTKSFTKTVRRMTMAVTTNLLADHGQGQMISNVMKPWLDASKEDTCTW